MTVTYKSGPLGFAEETHKEAADAAAVEKTSEDDSSSSANSARIDALESKLSGMEAQIGMLLSGF